MTIAYRASDGARLWARRVGDARYQDYARSLAVSPDGARVFTTGTSERSGGHATFTTVAFRSTTGRRIWTRRYEGPPGSYDSVDAVEVDPAGKRVYVTGNEELADGTEDYAIIAYRASTGIVAWERRYGAPPFGEDPLGLVVGRGGSSFFIVGTGPGEDGSYGFAASYRATDGRRMWTRTFDGPSYYAENGIGLNANGSQLYVIGSGVVAFRARTGLRLWTARFGGATGGYGSATALAVSQRDPRIYVTGESLRKGRGIGYLTVAYRGRTGTRLWSGRYEAPSSSSDGALAVAVSPGGTRVFVTGYSSGTGQDESYATIAYAA